MFWLLLLGNGLAQDGLGPQPEFDKLFHDRGLRIELYQSGDAFERQTTIHGLIEEAIWPENPNQLLTPFLYGKYFVKVFDAESKQLIYSKGFDTLFAEYATTKPALEGKKRTFQSTVHIPMPKNNATLHIERRMPDNSLTTILSESLDPKDIRIRKETLSKTCEVTSIQNTGHPHERVDVAFIAEGYTANERDKFNKDVERMCDHLFTVEPYASKKDRFNINAVFCESEESGTDHPRQGIYRNTILNSSFNALDIDRYLLVEDNHRIHSLAACVPHDAIVVLVNSSTYGGGSICLDYCVTTTDFPTSPMVFVHEFGHGMSYLADEYIGNVSYNDIYPEGIEPVEPNITRELDPSKIKWREFLTAGVPIPTPANQKQIGTETRIIGAFEGGGYLSKGIYRSEFKCAMGTSQSKQVFCIACQNAIAQMIEYYAPSDR